MKDYKRLTERDEFGNADIIGIGSYMLASELNFDEFKKLTSAINRFAELEDKIESGELVDRNEYLDRLMAAKNISGMKDKEIEFFAKHNARVRENAEAEIDRLTADRDEWKRRAEVAEQKATVWKDCANKWQKYYKEQAAREIEEEGKDD